jgi:hypothetical protein
VKVFVKGKGEASLTQQHFVATGGQASVYIKDGTAYKVYTDPKDTIPDAKFHELSSIGDPCVIKPEDILMDAKNHAVGYTMKALTDTFALCQLFTKAFRDRNNVTNAHIIKLACKLRQHIDGIHKHGILIVDLNELNILVPKTFDETYLIDVDSYQTKSFPATVIMPSVRDFSVPSKDFSPLSDWFSYGILAFQLFVGSHPYKGTHPPTESIDKDHRLEHRMRNHISAFNPEVRLPKCCYAFDNIPHTFRDWLKAVLNDGMRLPPPDPQGGPPVVIRGPVAVTQTQFVVTSGNLVIVEVLDLEKWKLVEYAESGGRNLALLSNGSEMRVVSNGHTLYQGPTIPGETLIGFTPKMNEPVALNLTQGKVTFIDFSRKKQEKLEFFANEIAKSGDRFYVRNGTRVLEVEFSELPSKIVVTASHMVADVLEMASHLYEGVAVQNMIGSIFVSLFPASKLGYQVRVPELDSYKVVDAKFDGGVLMVVGAKAGQYDRLVFRFDEHYATYDLSRHEDITPSGLNFVTLANGVCVSLTEDEKIEAFSSKKGSQTVKRIEDPALGNDMRLIRVNGKVGFERQGKIYQMSLK